MAILTAPETARLAQLAGESHKQVADRMLDDTALDLIAEAAAQMKDSTGLTPVDVGYVVTVDIYRAAAEAWRVKAGMIPDGFDFEAEGASFTRSQVYDHYMMQAGRYASMAAQMSVMIGRPVEDETVVNAFQEWLA